MIEGVAIKELRLIPDERGSLMEILRSDEELFTAFGQVYVTSCYPGVVKGWHLHRSQTDHLCCIRGEAKLAIYDEREGSSSSGLVQEIFLGERRPLLVRIPAGLWHGFKAIGVGEAIFLNVPDRTYDPSAPDEHRRPWDDASIPYDWERRNG